jgi:hypothetical protein
MPITGNPRITIRESPGALLILDMLDPRLHGVSDEHFPIQLECSEKVRYNTPVTKGGIADQFIQCCATHHPDSEPRLARAFCGAKAKAQTAGRQRDQTGREKVRLWTQNGLKRD